MNYQPVWGSSLPYQRDCQERYEVIRSVASQYNRRFSVLDIGANFGWFGFKMMSEFDCTVVMVDKKPINDLIDRHGDNRAWWLNRHLTGGEIERLSRSEHFDIVLGLSVLHHIGDFEAAYRGMTNLGSHVFIETQGDDTRAANPQVHERIDDMLYGQNEIALVKSHLGGKRPVYLITGEPSISEQTLDARERKAPDYGTYKLTSDFDSCRIEIDRSKRPTQLKTPVERRDFYPGMNLHNFRLLGGGHPKDPWLEAQMQVEHPDRYPWNFVIGHGVIPIDTINKWV